MNQILLVLIYQNYEESNQWYIDERLCVWFSNPCLESPPIGILRSII